MSERRIYLDHAATTPILPEVIDVVAATMATLGNPSSLHASGRGARRTVEESRESVADALGAGPNDVIFTSSGTEADNLAVKGIYWARRAAEPRRVRVLASAVEHHAVMDSLDWLVAEQGAEVEWMPVDSTGRLDTDAMRQRLAIDPGSVALVTVMWANNEVGTLQPIGEVVSLAHEYGVPVHSDAVQAVGQVPVHFAESRLDALTVSGHKVGGPMGSGVLLARRELDLVPVLHGGGQERDVRSGTLDAPSTAGLAVALRTAVSDLPARTARVTKLRDALIEGVLAEVPDAVLNGDPRRGLPGHAHFSFSGCAGDAMLMLLDSAGIDCSTGSACTSGVPQPSHVLLAMGVDPVLARAALRFTLGSSSTESDVRALTAAIAPAAERARAAGPMNVSSAISEVK